MCIGLQVSYSFPKDRGEISPRAFDLQKHNMPNMADSCRNKTLVGVGDDN